jgi:histidyl-tRNA synthetase
MSRLVGAQRMVRATRDVPTAVLVSVLDESHRGESDRVAQTLRDRGISADVAPAAAKFGKQIRYADRRGIPFIWFPGAEGTDGEVKDIRSGEQLAADAATWTPPAEDLRPRVLAVGDAPTD